MKDYGTAWRILRVSSLTDQIYIKANRIIITTSHKQENWGLVVISKSLAATLRSLFHMLWQQATPVTSKTISQLGKNDYFEAEKTRD